MLQCWSLVCQWGEVVEPFREGAWWEVIRSLGASFSARLRLLLTRVSCYKVRPYCLLSPFCMHFSTMLGGRQGVHQRPERWTLSQNFNPNKLPFFVKYPDVGILFQEWRTDYQTKLMNQEIVLNTYYSLYGRKITEELAF